MSVFFLVLKFITHFIIWQHFFNNFFQKFCLKFCCYFTKIINNLVNQWFFACLSHNLFSPKICEDQNQSQLGYIKQLYNQVLLVCILSLFLITIVISYVVSFINFNNVMINKPNIWFSTLNFFV